MKITLVAALDRAYGIGSNNQMPWHLPDDFKQFKAYTLGKPVIMGRLTALSLGRALPGRRNLVLTRQDAAPFAGMEPITSMEQALSDLRAQGVEEVCVIGGGQVYAQALDLATDLRLTWVNTEIPADTLFPQFDTELWRPVSRLNHAKDDRHAFDYAVIHYERVLPKKTAA